jgi:hypothetical protein
MEHEPTPTIVWVFFGTWAALGIAFFVFSRVASIELRRRVRIPISIGVGALFVAFVGLIGGIGHAMFAILPVALIVAMQITGERICPSCGKSVRNPNIFAFSAPRYCQHCGTKLDS